MNRLILVLLVVTALFLSLTSVVQSLASPDEPAPPAARILEEGIRAQVQDNVLYVFLPVHWNSSFLERAVAHVAVVDLSGKTVAQRSAFLYHLKDEHLYKISLPLSLELKNPSLLCIDYSLTLSDDNSVRGRKSLAAALGSLETRLIGSKEFFAGSTAALRLVALEHYSGEPVEDALVSFKLEGIPQPLFEGRTSNGGTVDASFLVPSDIRGKRKLVVQIGSPLGTDALEVPVEIKKSYKILLTTDKPLYQPGQVIHIRSLSLSVASAKPAANEEAILEVFDAKSNKVFKLRKKTDDFGIAAADFTLANEINMGTYKVRITVGNDVVEKDVTVKRYVLPKFKATLSTDRSYYAPGEELRADVQADYFFGKPVANGVVLVKASAFDVEFSEFAQVEGKTDNSGHYAFSVRLPEHFVGQPLAQGKALVKIDVKVVDGSDHQETATRTFPVSADPLTLVAVPESGTLVPGMENQVYLIATYPDGTPAEANIDVSFGQPGRRTVRLQTNKLGIASIGLTPTENNHEIAVSARDRKGNQVTKNLALPLEQGTDHLLLRTDATLYKAGDTIKGVVFGSRQRGNVYVDVVKGGQTILTQTAELQGGKAEFTITASPDLSGTLQVSAYQILPSSDIIRDSALVFVEPATDLKIEVRPDRVSYQPGESAAIEFAVKTASGHPVLAALGVSIVDESVFALQEMQPGLEKVFFLLEKELMKPRYEIHGFSMEDVILEKPKQLLPEDNARREQAARVLMAAVEQVREPDLNLNSFQQKEQAYATEIQKLMLSRAPLIENALRRYHRRHERFPIESESLQLLLDEHLLARSAAYDPWGNLYRVRDIGYAWKDQISFQILSSGPDERWGTMDDVSVRQSPPMPERRWAGAVLGRVEEGFMAPMMKMKDESDMLASSITSNAPAGSGEKEADKPAVRIREFFPETLFFNPALITDKRGKARLELALADSITTWRMAVMASSMAGQLGSTSAPIRVFQDFFIDIDTPVTVTQNDRLSLPIAVYNYLPDIQNVRLELTQEDWFELQDEPVKELEIETNEVSVVYFTIVAKEVGWHSLTIHGYGSKMNDAIKRQVQVVPDGEEHVVNFNDRLERDIRRVVTFPSNSIRNASSLLVKLYPGMFSQVVEGLDSILRMPSGCFEQTSSTTYPNILVLDYLKKTKQVNPEIQMKAEGFINTGYQRLLSFEVNGGGFEWFGNPPANQILTAYGLMEFHDMAKVHEVDPTVLERTQRWLLSKQQADGSWRPDESFLHQESWSRIQNSNVPVTAYVTWALLESDYAGPETEKAIHYLKNNFSKADDAYTLALCANALVLADRNDVDALEALAKLAVEENDAVHWKGEQTMTYANGISADVETTSLATIAFLRSGRYPEISRKALTYLIRSKDASGTWHSTQATVLAMKAMVTALGSMNEEADGEVTVEVNGKEAQRIRITSDNSDVMRQIDLTQYIREGDNQVNLSFTGKGNLLYQVVGRYYLPWTAQEKPREALLLDVKYDKTRLEKDDVVTCTASIRNNAPAAANMLVVDLGVPPGFSVQSEGLEKVVADGTIEKFSLTGRQIIIYVRQLGAGKALEFSYQLKAKFPIRAKTPSSRVYHYYDPAQEGIAQPVMLEIIK